LLPRGIQAIAEGFAHMCTVYVMPEQGQGLMPRKAPICRV
jgi:hypothetical protein